MDLDHWLAPTSLTVLFIVFAIGFLLGGGSKEAERRNGKGWAVPLFYWWAVALAFFYSDSGWVFGGGFVGWVAWLFFSDIRGEGEARSISVIRTIAIVAAVFATIAAPVSVVRLFMDGFSPPWVAVLLGSLAVGMGGFTVHDRLRDSSPASRENTQPTHSGS